MKRVCPECGCTFETTSSRRKYCYNVHKRTCKVCGVKFFVTPSDISSNVQTCSEECRRRAISEFQKSQHLSHQLTCIECGSVFESASSYPPVCGNTHLRVCKGCKKLFIVTPQQIMSDTQTCSAKCRAVLAKQTFQSRYGVENPAQLESSKEKYRQTCIKKYGTDNAMKSDDVKAKNRATCIEKYGTESFTQTPEFIAKCKSTHQEKRGADWATQTEETKSKRIATCLERYGVDNPSKSSSEIADRMSYPENIQNLLEFRDDPAEFIRRMFTEPPTLKQLADVCRVRDSSIGQIINDHGLRDLVSYTYSAMEDEVYQFLRELLPQAVIERNCRNVIKPYELDLYLPDYGFAIECNPTITHNSSIGGFGPSDAPKSPSYHQMETKMCDNKNIFLYHIFGYDWTHRREVCKSMIRNVLGLTSVKLYARNTRIQEVPAKDAHAFLEANHRQGGVHSKVRLGLYANGELVSLMTFSKMRNTIGTDGTDLGNCWELVRFCNKLNTSVIGGASKLFKHFVRTRSPERIRSFSDRAHTRGGLYETSGSQLFDQAILDICG